MERRAQRREGFTLIEMSVVLVIIGLIVGGILVGRDLVRASEMRAQISQIEKYNTAVNTFRGKFGYLPGDINAASATQFGFAARGAYTGQGDGNGVIEGTFSGSSDAACGGCAGAGEPELFWNDLTYANGLKLNLVEGSFNKFGGGGVAGNPVPPGITGSALEQYLPPAKLGLPNYVYVWSENGLNYFGLTTVTKISYYQLFTSPGLTVAQAYAMDSKVDDGLPQSGRVISRGANAGTGASWVGVAPATPVSGSATTCYDNTNSASNPMQYSMTQRGGAGVNCALSFQFQ